MPDFIEKNWGAFSKYPFVFLSTALLCLGIGFSAGKLFYGTIADTARERLEAARDDMARLERAKREESEKVSQLRLELKELDNKLAVFTSNTIEKKTVLMGNIAKDETSLNNSTF